MPTRRWRSVAPRPPARGSKATGGACVPTPREGATSRPTTGRAPWAGSRRYGWQAAAGHYAALGRAPSGEAAAVLRDAEPGPGSGRDALVERAVASGNEHAIKFTEACLREHALSPRRVYLAAARDAVRQLGPG